MMKRQMKNTDECFRGVRGWHGQRGAVNRQGDDKGVTDTIAVGWRG